MAIAFDNATDGGNASSVTSLTFAHTITGSKLALVVVAIGDTSPDGASITATYNSVSMTQVDNVNNQASQNRRVCTFLLIAPASGTNNVVLTRGTSGFLAGGAASYTGVKQSGQPDAHTTNNAGAAASTLTTSLTTVADNAWTVLAEEGYNGNPAPAAGTGSTRRKFDATFGTWGLFDSGGVITPAGSYSMTTTRTTSVNSIVHLVLSLAPDTTSTDVTPCFQPLSQPTNHYRPDVITVKGRKYFIPARPSYRPSTQVLR